MEPFKRPLQQFEILVCDQNENIPISTAFPDWSTHWMKARNVPLWGAAKAIQTIIMKTKKHA
jgi:hypothetical protein